MRYAFTMGTVADLSSPKSEGNLVAIGASWPAEWQVDGVLIRKRLTSTANDTSAVRTLRIRGARIMGELKLGQLTSKSFTVAACSQKPHGRFAGTFQGRGIAADVQPHHSPFNLDH